MNDEEGDPIWETSDIKGTSNAFQFFFEQVGGTCEIVMRVLRDQNDRNQPQYLGR